MSGNVRSQDKRPLYVVPELWSEIATRLGQDSPPTTYEFIPQLVEAHFKSQPDSIYPAYYAVMIRLERLFNLNAAIYVGEEMARVAKKQNHPEREAAAYSELSRYYNAAGIYQLAALNTEKALAIYKVLGDEKAILAVNFARISLKLPFLKQGRAIPPLESLLERAVAIDARMLVKKIHLRLMQQKLLARQYREAEKHVLFLENLPVSDPIKPQEYPYLIEAAKGRAKLALAADDLVAAERYYQKTLKLSREEPGPWIEIFTLHALTELELKRGRHSQAKSYLEEALSKAERLQLHDLLTQTYALKTRIAEQENNPADALRFLKKKIFHEEKFKARSGDFNLENFYLQAERDKLAADKKNNALELSLKKSQLTYSIVILSLVALLAVGFVLGYLHQRRRKAELADKNALIQQHADQLSSLDVAKSRFFANVSHELRTPLSLILAPLTTLLKEKQWSEKQTVLLNAASRSARQLETMVKDILDLRKLEMGKMPLHEEPTELGTFFQLHLEHFESLAQWRQIHYSHEIRLAPALVGQLDREKCRQVLYNLLSNAFKFTPALGKVEVAVWMQGDRLAFRVADTGPGIHPDDLPQVFDRFFQSNRKSRPSVDGTGIGLSICREYTQLMHGDIRAESEPGEGSVFQVLWPVALCENSHEVASIEITEIVRSYEGTVPMPESVAAHQPTILVVEDNPGLREYLHLILSEHYNILLAENGAVALQKLAVGDAQVDLVMSDLMMPVMDGYDLLEKLKSGDATRHIPVIMLTARAELADRLQALRIGVDDYLTKPFEEDELLVRIANLLKNQSVRKQEALLENKAVEPSTGLSETDQAWLGSRTLRGMSATIWPAILSPSPPWAKPSR